MPGKMLPWVMRDVLMLMPARLERWLECHIAVTTDELNAWLGQRCRTLCDE